MRPITLTLSAFGSFPGTETIDFDEIGRDGLFLVTGATGTGKSTLFDAMCWAMYGETPREGPVRSGHVAETTRCEVRFCFEVDGTRYEVTRNPEQLRPALRGSGHAKEPAGADLVRIEGEVTRPVAAKSRPVTEACEAIIGLNAAQFQRVVLLPQGEFSAFLRAGTGEREELLSRLFGAARYDAIVEQLKAEHDACRTASATATERLTTKLTEAAASYQRALDALGDTGAEPSTPEPSGPEPVGVDPGPDPDAASPVENPSTPAPDRATVGRLAASLTELLAAAEARVSELEGHATLAAEEFRTTQVAHKRFIRASELRSELDELHARDAEIDRVRHGLEASRAARPVVEAADALEEARTHHATVTEQMRERTESVCAAFTHAGIPIDQPGSTAFLEAREALRRRTEGERSLLDELARTAEAVEKASTVRDEVTADLEAAEAARRTTLEETESVDTRLAELRSDRTDPTEIDTEITSFRERRSTRRDLDNALAERPGAKMLSDEATTTADRLFTEFVTGQAPRLAESLRPGAPCPVCGSTDHPAPAHGDGTSVSTDDLDAARTQQTAALERLREIESRVASLLGQLGAEKDRTIDEWDEAVHAASVRRAAAATVLEELQTLETRRDKLAQQLIDATGQVTTLTERSTASAAALEVARLGHHDAAAAAADLDPARTTDCETALVEIARDLTGFDGLETEAVRSATSAADRQTALAERLDASSFATVDAARAVLRDPKVESAASDAVAAHATAVTEATARLAELGDAGIPTSEPDISAAAGTRDVTRQRFIAVRDRLASARAHRATADAALTDHDRTAGDHAALVHRAEIATRTWQVCSSGGSQLPMSLKRWVLTRELDRITDVANTHLATMSGGRYALHRQRERGDARRVHGLDLEVFDAHTGVARPTTTLSGGEQFQASLALALGLADVIARGGSGSGHRYESLFVDEGFGSLDAEALETAVGTLVSLQGTGRMVGAITHVESMKEQLRVGVEVRRLDGGGSTLARLG